MKKYILFPGYVYSMHDGDRHFIGAKHLIKLYKIDPQECIIYKDEHSLQGYSPGQLESMICLYPKSDGNYTIDNQINCNRLQKK